MQMKSASANVIYLLQLILGSKCLLGFQVNCNKSQRNIKVEFGLSEKIE